MNTTSVNFNGVAVIIDDKVNDPNSDAAKLKDYIMNNGIPLAFINEIPIPQNQIAFIKRIYDASFIILDWIFSPLPEQNKLQGVVMPQEKNTTNEQDTIDFLKKLLDNTYCPIFIISNENKDSIEASLCACSDIKGGCHHPRIFIHNWGELSVNNLFQKIKEWVSGSPIIQIFKEWEESARMAKLSMFSDLEGKSPYWPSVLWKSFIQDTHCPRPIFEMAQTLSTLFVNRITCDFQKVNFDEGVPSPNDIRAVLEGTRFISVDKKIKPAPGDLFLDGNNNYYINVRAQCNILREDNPYLYCIKGRVFDEEQINKPNGISFSNGEFLSKKHQIIVPFVCNNKILEFNCRNFLVLRYNGRTATVKTVANPPNDCQIIAERIGRILPPYITYIQQIISSYIVREGLPSIPENAIPTPERSGNSLFFSVPSPGIDFNNEKWSFISSPTSICPQIISISCKSQLD